MVCGGTVLLVGDIRVVFYGVGVLWLGFFAWLGFTNTHTTADFTLAAESSHLL